MIDQTPIRFTVELDKRDWRVFEDLLFKRADAVDPKPPRSASRVARVALATIFFGALIWSGAEFVVQWGWAFLRGEALVPLAAILFIGCFAAGWYRSILRGRRYQREPVQGGSFLGDWHYDVDDTGLSARISGIERWQDWRSFAAAFESADHFFLMVDREHGFTLPKRGFDEPADVDSFRDLVTAKVGELRAA